MWSLLLPNNGALGLPSCSAWLRPRSCFWATAATSAAPGLASSDTALVTWWLWSGRGRRAPRRAATQDDHVLLGGYFVLAARCRAARRPAGCAAALTRKVFPPASARPACPSGRDSRCSCSFSPRRSRRPSKRHAPVCMPVSLFSLRLCAVRKKRNPRRLFRGGTEWRAMGWGRP